MPGSPNRNHAVAAARGCDASSQKVDAPPSSRETSIAPLGLFGKAGDEASPAPSATRRRSHAATRASGLLSNGIVPAKM